MEKKYMGPRAVWRWLSAQTLRGLLLLVPLIITVEFIVWLSRTIENQLQPLAALFLPQGWYVPGLALLTLLVGALLLGLLTRNVLLRKAIDLTERGMARMPVIGSIYPVVRQLTDLLSGKDKSQQGSVVLVSLPGAAAQVIGIVTRPGTSVQLPWLPPESDLVYIPMSYGIGGFTLILPRAQLQPLDMNAAEALQMIMMGGIVQPKATRA
jgi:uncharacterized membrane protein